MAFSFGIVLSGVLALGGGLSILRVPDPWSRRAALYLFKETFVSSRGVVLQRNSLDCGPAAAANLLRLRGLKPNLAALESEMDPGILGTTINKVARVLNQNHLPVKITIWSNSRLLHLPKTIKPVITLRTHHFYVILGRVGLHSILLVDPWIGVVRMQTAQFELGWTHYVVE